ncbi:MAG: carboxypeptidase regulatory-like domain-containing protein [Prevotella sp.]|nr:carboxypeptidase regulatory-like domain-containing protein [Prevotella sp.]
MKKILLLCLMALPLFLSCTKEENDSFGTLYGVVSDVKTGSPLDNVTVTLSPGGTTKLTGSDGLFEYSELTPQQYTITVQKTGYQTNRKTLSAVVGEKTEANITMTPQ